MFSQVMLSIYEFTCTKVRAVLIMTIASTGEFKFRTNLGLHSQQWGKKTPQRPHFEGNTWQLSQSTLWQFVFLTDRVLTGRQRIMTCVRSAGRSATAECRARSRLGEQQTLLSAGLASVHTCCFFVDVQWP